jgi:hypothetical protein
MVIGLLRVRLHIPGANSLKDKRAVLKPLIHRLRTGHNVAVAEIHDQDVWRSAVLAIATVYASHEHVESLLVRLAKEIAGGHEYEVVEESTEYL